MLVKLITYITVLFVLSACATTPKETPKFQVNTENQEILSHYIIQLLKDHLDSTYLIAESLHAEKISDEFELLDVCEQGSIYLPEKRVSGKKIGEQGKFYFNHCKINGRTLHGDVYVEYNNYGADYRYGFSWSGSLEMIYDNSEHYHVVYKSFSVNYDLGSQSLSGYLRIKNHHNKDEKLTLRIRTRYDDYIRFHTLDDMPQKGKIEVKDAKRDHFTLEIDDFEIKIIN